jgi:steroid delta-isomerase-like uncharacterized protein
MTPEQLKSRTRAGFEQMFNRGELEYVDETLADDAIDHQEPVGTDCGAHLKDVISTLRTAFPDLHFDLHEALCEGDVVACRSTMTGTHQGPLKIGPMAGLPITGARIEVAHMHFLRYDDHGRMTDLWHVWDTLKLARQLGAPAPDLRVGTPQ